MPRTYVDKIAQKLHIPILDATNPVRVQVTQADVVMAQKANSKSCALARASVRVPGVTKGYFFRTTAYLKFRDKIVRYQLPPSVQKEIVSFDRAKIFGPGSYQLSPPNPSKNKAVSANYRAERAKKTADRPAVAANRGTRTNGTKTGGVKLTSKTFTAKVTAIVDPPKRHQVRTKYVRDAREPRG